MTRPKISWKDELIQLIKQKKELRQADDELVEKKLDTVLKRQPKLVRILEEKQKTSKSFDKLAKSKPFRELVKIVRSELREIYGVFLLKGYEKKDKTLARVNKNSSIEEKKKACDEILKLHRSSKERFPYYEEVYNNIFSRTGNPKSILDLACGMNPLSYHYLGLEPEYIASELNNSDCEFINTFFALLNIKGYCFQADLMQEAEYQKFPKADICLLLKTLDSLETVKRGTSFRLLKAIPSKNIVVSFPKTSLGAKKRIEKQKRNWFFSFVDHQGWNYELFEVQNEFFVILKKN